MVNAFRPIFQHTGHEERHDHHPRILAANFRKSSAVLLSIWEETKFHAFSSTSVHASLSPPSLISKNTQTNTVIQTSLSILSEFGPSLAISSTPPKPNSFANADSGGNDPENLANPMISYNFLSSSVTLSGVRREGIS